MLTCRDVMQQIADYLAGKLTQEQSQQIDWHMAHCLDCLLALSAARQTPKGSGPQRTSHHALQE